MDKLIVCETDRGRYAVRYINWAGIWNEKGQIQESLNHLALFTEKEDAEKFVEWKEAEEQNRLLKLPCAVGDMVFKIYKGEIIERIVRGILFRDGELWGQDGNGSNFGIFWKTVFLTSEEAEAALKEL